MNVNPENERNILKARESTKLDLRKQKVTKLILDKKLHIADNLIDITYFINPDQIDQSSNNLRTSLLTLKEHLSYINDAFLQKNSNMLKHAIYSTRRFMISEQRPTDSKEYEDNFNDLYQLIIILDQHKAEVSILLEIIWVLGIVFYYLKNELYISLIYTDNLLKLAKEAIKLSNCSHNTISIVLTFAGNGITSDKNKLTFLNSPLFEYILEILKQDLSIEILTICMWIFYLIVEIEPKLKVEDAEFILDFFCYYGKMIEYDGLVDKCLSGIVSILNYKGSNRFTIKLWDSGIIQKHMISYRNHKELNQLDKLNTVFNLVCIFGNIIISEDFIYSDLLDKCGFLELICDVIIYYYSNHQFINENPLMIKALWVISNVALDNKGIVIKFLNEDYGIFYKIFSILKRPGLNVRTIYEIMQVIEALLMHEEPQITLKLMKLGLVEILVDTMENCSLGIILKLIHIMIKRGEEMEGSGFTDSNIVLMKIHEIGLKSKLELLLLSTNNQKVMQEIKSLIEILIISEQLFSYSTAMDISK